MKRSFEMRSVKYVVSLVIAAVILGCEKANESPKETAQMTNDVVVVVNGASLDKKSVECEIAIQVAILRQTKPNVQVSEVEKLRSRMLASAEKRFLERRAMLDEAARRKIVLSEEDRKAIRVTFSKAVMHSAKAYEKLCASLTTDQRAELEAGLDKDMLCQKVSAALRAECDGSVADAEVEEKYKGLVDYNVGAKAEEARIWSDASNLWHRIVGGEAFETVGESLATSNEHVRCDAEWGEFELSFFKDDKDLLHYLETMSVGEVTPPVTGDNGLMIVKLNGIIPVDFENGVLRPRYQLGMIFFNLPECYPLTTKEKLRQELSEIKVDRALKKRQKEIISSAKVEHPQGKKKLLAQ